MKRLQILLSIIVVITFVALGVSNTVGRENKLKFNEIQLKNTTNDLKLEQIKTQDLEKKLDEAIHKGNTSDETIKKLEQEIEQRKQREQELEQQVSAKKEAQRIAAERVQNAASLTSKAYAAAAPTVGSVGNCGDNMYKQYIYQHESGCVTDKWNSSGCYGIGQACPASKIAHCGADFACQDAWFTNYAVTRYGSWAGAYNFWVNNHWW